MTMCVCVVVYVENVDTVWMFAIKLSNGTTLPIGYIWPLF